DVELVRVHAPMADAEGRREPLRVGEIFRRHRRRYRGERLATVAEHVVGDAEQERRIDAPGKRDEHGRHVGEEAAQTFELRVECHQIPSAWNRSVVRYRSPVSGKIVRTTAPRPSRRATPIAAAHAAPDEMPTSRPS